MLCTVMKERQAKQNIDFHHLARDTTLVMAQTGGGQERDFACSL